MPAAANYVVFVQGCPAMVDHTPGSNVAAGAVVVTGDTTRICHNAIEANRLGALAAGDGQGVYRGVGDGVIAADKKIRWDAASGKLSLTKGVPCGVSVAACTGDGVAFNWRHDNGLGAEALATAALAAAGSTAADAALLVDMAVTSVSGADGTKGVILPAGGSYAEVYNEHATNGLKIYPPSGGTINGAAADAPITMEGKTRAELRRVSTTNWSADFTANS